MDIRQKAIELLTNYGILLFKVALVIFIGSWIIKLFIKSIDKMLKKSKIDISLHSFIKSLFNISLKIALYISAATMLGIPMTTFITILGAAGLAIGLALKDSLSNFAGGILILVFRPFGVGDYIQVESFGGTVKEIHLLFTNIVSPDNKKIIIPNGDLTNAKIINFSSEETRRVDLILGVSYIEDIIKVKDMLIEIVNNHPLTLKENDHIIRVREYGPDSIKFDVKVWCKATDYWTVYYDLHEQIKLTFDKNNITIPFPQMNVHLIK